MSEDFEWPADAGFVVWGWAVDLERIGPRPFRVWVRGPVTSAEVRRRLPPLDVVRRTRRACRKWLKRRGLVRRPPPLAGEIPPADWSTGGDPLEDIRRAAAEILADTGLRRELGPPW